MILEGVPSDALACRVYGSFVRGELDESSDIDLLIIIDRMVDADEKGSVRLVAEPQRYLSVSWYSSDRVHHLWREGDLFAWHLFGESRSLSVQRGDFIDILGRPADYNDALEDVDQLIATMKGGAASVGACPGNLLYEAGILYVCCRNIALCASWYTREGLCFSRYSPYMIQSRASVEFGIDASVYNLLVGARLKGTRNGSCAKIGQADFLAAHSAALCWANKVREFITGRGKS